MFVAVGRYEIFIPHSASLKDKRRVLRAITSTVRQRFNASIAEVEYQDLWQRCAFGVTCVSESGDHARRMLDEIERQMARASNGDAEIVGRYVRIVALDDL